MIFVLACFISTFPCADLHYPYEATGRRFHYTKCTIVCETGSRPQGWTSSQVDQRCSISLNSMLLYGSHVYPLTHVEIRRVSVRSMT
jgi:hypothetical protein